MQLALQFPASPCSGTTATARLLQGPAHQRRRQAVPVGILGLHRAPVGPRGAALPRHLCPAHRLCVGAGWQPGLCQRLLGQPRGLHLQARRGGFAVPCKRIGLPFPPRPKTKKSTKIHTRHGTLGTWFRMQGAGSRLQGAGLRPVPGWWCCMEAWVPCACQGAVPMMPMHTAIVCSGPQTLNLQMRWSLASMPTPRRNLANVRARWGSMHACWSLPSPRP